MPEEMREVMALLERELKTMKGLDPFHRGSTPSELKLQPSCTLCACDTIISTTDQVLHASCSAVVIAYVILERACSLPRLLWELTREEIPEQYRSSGDIVFWAVIAAVISLILLH